MAKISQSYKNPFKDRRVDPALDLDINEIDCLKRYERFDDYLRLFPLNLCCFVLVRLGY